MSENNSDETETILNFFKKPHETKRMFTVQALTNCEVLTLSIADLEKMSKEFFDAFISIFEFANTALVKMLSLKHDVIKDCKDDKNVLQYSEISAKNIKF